MFWGMTPMDGIATPPVSLSSEAIAQKAALEASPKSPYRIPDGCLLRNTFLEWEDENEEAMARQRRGARRSRSCPAENTTPPEPCKLGCESSLSTRSPTSEAGTAPMEESFHFDGMPGEDASFLHMEQQWHAWPDPETWQEAESWHDVECWHHAESWRDTENWRDTESWRDTENWRETESWQEPEQDESAWTASEWSQTSKGREQKGRTRSTPAFLVLRGLPFNSTEAEVRSFVESCGVSSDDLSSDGGVVLLANAQGRPSGFAEVHLARAADFWQIQELLHKQNLGGRYVEALEPRPARKPGGGSSRRSGKQWRR